MKSVNCFLLVVILIILCIYCFRNREGFTKVSLSDRKKCKKNLGKYCWTDGPCCTSVNNCIDSCNDIPRPGGMIPKQKSQTSIFNKIKSKFKSNSKFKTQIKKIFKNSRWKPRGDVDVGKKIDSSKAPLSNWERRWDSDKNEVYYKHIQSEYVASDYKDMEDKDTKFTTWESSCMKKKDHMKCYPLGLSWTTNPEDEKEGALFTGTCQKKKCKNQRGIDEKRGNKYNCEDNDIVLVHSIEHKRKEDEKWAGWGDTNIHNYGQQGLDLNFHSDCKEFKCELDPWGPSEDSANIDDWLGWCPWLKHPNDSKHGTDI
jgi:hypothetical protein